MFSWTKAADSEKRNLELIPETPICGFQPTTLRVMSHASRRIGGFNHDQFNLSAIFKTPWCKVTLGCFFIMPLNSHIEFVIKDLNLYL